VSALSRCCGLSPKLLSDVSLLSASVLPAVATLCIVRVSWQLLLLLLMQSKAHYKFRTRTWYIMASQAPAAASGTCSLA
jgi:hypothetical protein